MGRAVFNYAAAAVYSFLTLAGAPQQQPEESQFIQAIEEAKASADQAKIAGALQHLAFYYWKEGSYGKAVPLYKETLEIVKAYSTPHTHDLVACLNNLALTYRALGRYQEGKQMHEEALRVLRADANPNPKLLADTYLALGVLALTLSHLQEAEQWLNEAKPVVEKLQSGELAYARLMDTYARLYIELGKPREAEYAHRQSWTAADKRLPANCTERMRYLDTRASVYFGLSRYTEAAKAWTEALDVANSIGPVDSPDSLAIVSHLGKLYLYLGEEQKAELYLEKTREMMEKFVGPGTPEAADIRGELGLLYTRTGHRDRARQSFDSALTILDAPGANRPLELATLLTSYGEFLVGDGRLEEAYRQYKRAMEMREVLGDHPLLLSSIQLCSDMSRRLKHKDEARRYAARAAQMASRLPQASWSGQTVDVAALKSGHESAFSSRH